MLGSDQLVPPSNPWTGPREWIDRVNRALSASRWVTLVGPVGSGKTRLAREAAAVAHPRAVHLRVDPGERALSLETKLESLGADAHPLLVVDAADRAPAAIRSLLPRWLGVHDERRVLVTSRTQLGPGEDTTLWMPAFEAEEACRLFEQFVRESGASFDFETHRAALVRALVELGGAPLAILGLARRALVLGPADLFDSASHARGRLDLPTPDGTLHDAVAEAWNALPSHAQPYVSALAVFAEPASPKDIADVSELDLGALETLFAHSAIRSRITEGQKQLEVVPLLRDLATLTAPDAAAQRRHRSLFLQRAQAQPNHPRWRELAAAADCANDPADALALWVSAAAGIAYGGSARRALAAVERLWPEHPTPRQRLALGTLARIAGESSRGLEALSSGYDDAADPALKAQLACALATAQRHTNDLHRARSTFKSIIESESTPQSTRAEAWERLGGLELEQGSVVLAEQHLQRAEDGFHQTADLAGIARVRHVRGLIAQERGDFDAAELAFNVALRDHQASGADRFAAIAIFDLGALLLERGRVGAARRTLHQALHALQYSGDRRQVGLTHALLGICASEDGDSATAWSESQKARESLDRGDTQANETLGLYAAHLAGAPVPSQTTDSDEARYAKRLIESIVHRAHTRVIIREDGGMIEHPTRGRCEVRSDAARRILASLVDALERGPTPSVHRDALIRAGWPDRRRVDTTSRNRFNVELSRLRKSGLHDQLQRSGDGYHLTGPLLVEPCSTADN